MTCPPRTPQPARATLNACGKWSRPAVRLALGARPALGERPLQFVEQVEAAVQAAPGNGGRQVVGRAVGVVDQEGGVADAEEARADALALDADEAGQVEVGRSQGAGHERADA